MLHYKSLKRQDMSGKVSHDGDEHDNADLGKIVNLMQLVIVPPHHEFLVEERCRGDSYAVAQRFWEFSALFTSPVRLVIALVFLYR